MRNIRDWSILMRCLNKIYEVLKENDGFLALHDKSDPETIRDMMQMSKKTFKKGLGTLYKARKITLEEGGIAIATTE